MKKVFNENVVILEEGGRIHFAYMAMSGEFDILKKCGAKRLSGLRLFIRETSSARWRYSTITPEPLRRNSHTGVIRIAVKEEFNHRL